MATEDLKQVYVHQSIHKQLKHASVEQERCVKEILHEILAEHGYEVQKKNDG